MTHGVIGVPLTLIILLQKIRSVKRNEVGPIRLDHDLRCIIDSITQHVESQFNGQESTSTLDTLQVPHSPRKPLKAARRSASNPVNTRFMPNRCEPENSNCWKTVPASSAKHGSAKDLQHPPGRTVHSRCLHHLPARSQHSSQHRWPRPRQRLLRTPIAQRHIREHISQPV